MKGHALVAIAVLATSAATAEDRCASLTETGMAAVTNLEVRQIRVENLRANLPAQPSVRQKGELTRAIADLSRAARSVHSLVSEAVSANCPVGDALVEAQSTTEEVVAEGQAPEEVETPGHVQKPVCEEHDGGLGVLRRRVRERGRGLSSGRGWLTAAVGLTPRRIAPSTRPIASC